MPWLKRQVWQKALLGSGSLMVALALCEVVARIMVSGPQAQREQSDFVDKIVYPAVPGSQHIWFQLHPFFGYVGRPDKPGVNNQGFPTDLPYPYEKAPDEFVIGLFGGSVAEQLLKVQEDLIAPLRSVLQRRGYTKVTLLPFVAGGWRQPQTFFAMVLALDSLDMVVNLDGFNEVNLLSDLILTTQPASFPWSEVYGALSHNPTDDQIVTRAELISIKREASEATRSFRHSLVSRSRMAHLIWRAYSLHQARRLASLRPLETRADAFDWSGYEPTNEWHVPVARARYMEQWMKLITISRSLCESQGKLFFEFIQPNQYYKGSKPLSAEEEAVDRTNPDKHEHLNELYDYVAKHMRQQHDEGIQSYFLGNIFRAQKQTLYADSCCHFNPTGLQLIAEAMASTILKSGQLDQLRPLATTKALNGPSPP